MFFISFSRYSAGYEGISQFTIQVNCEIKTVQGRSYRSLSIMRPSISASGKICDLSVTSPLL